jgi:homoserine dehydrogenase
MSETITRYHVRLDVADRPGVLAQVAGVFAAHGVSIEAVQQRHDDSGRAVLVVVTHSATDAALSTTVDELERLDIVDSVAGVLRVEGGDA